MKKILLPLLATSLLASYSFAASAASDNASDTAYIPTWDNGDNGGTGFGAWALSSTGTGGSYIGTTGQGADSFGIFSGTSGTYTAARSFTGGALAAGQTFSIDLGHTPTISSGNDIGILLTDGGVAVFTLKFVGGQPNWLINDGGLDFGAGQAYAANTSISFAFTFNGGSDYSYTFGTGSGSNFTASNAINGIDGFTLFNNNQGNGENLGFNNISIVPEPSSFALLAGILGLSYVAVRRRS